MAHITCTYALRRYLSSKDRDYQAAVDVYLTNIAPGSRTNSNEITYWVDRYPGQFEDEFCVCGFYSDGRVVGFAEFVYFRKERLVFFDYLVLHRNYRTHGEYFQFAKMLKSLIDKERFEFDYAAAEVAYDSAGVTPSERSLALVELFKLVGFSVADCQYYQPPLGLENPQSDMRAYLLVTAREKIHFLKRDTLLDIVKTVYYKHYGRWYAAFLDQPERYTTILDSRIRDLERDTASKDVVVLNGTKLNHPPFPTSAPRRAKRHFPLLMACLASLLILFVCSGLLFLQHAFSAPNTVLVVILTGAILICAVAFSLFYPRGAWILEKVLDAIKYYLRKRK